MMLWTKRFKIFFASFLLLAGVVGGIWFYTHQPKITISDFQEQRDTPFILDIFDKNWHWLVSEYSTDFSPQFMLKHKASSKNPLHQNNLTIKVMYDDTQPVGFVAYYKKKFYEGFVLFLALKEEFRSKGYAARLLRYALADLKKHGCTIIRLVTRTTNDSAIRLYTHVGFRQTHRENGFVYFHYYV